MTLLSNSGTFKRCIAFSLLIFLFAGQVSGKVLEPVFKVKTPVSKILAQYLTDHQAYSRQLCTPTVEKQFRTLYNQFQKTRYLIPVDKNGTFDHVTVQAILPQLKRKVEWISEEKKKLSSQIDFTAALQSLDKIESLIAEQLRYKYQHTLANKIEMKRKYRGLAQKNRRQIFLAFSKLIKEIPFLLSYSFPVDHLASRLEYDRLKDRPETLQQANLAYMVRKVVEDGAQDKSGARSDLFLRSSIDTIYLSLSKKAYLLSEEERYDLTALLKSVRYHLQSGKNVLLERLSEWEKRTSKTYDFYSHLSDKLKNQDSSLTTVAGALLKKKAESTFALKKFVLEKQRDSYLFWIDRPELYRALFAIETILYNEVGRKDPYKLERQDIVKLIINRHRIPLYSELTFEDSIYSFLPDDLLSKSHSNPWLDLLFKEGEFSFTYFYFAETVRLFCPDMGPAGKKLRLENLRIALNLLLKPEIPYPGLRYFSRESMIGRIDMAKVWDNFEAIEEAPADELKRPDLIKKYRQNKYIFFYGFKDASARAFHVVGIDGQTYVVDPKRVKIFGYRNPHQFTFFKLND